VGLSPTGLRPCRPLHLPFSGSLGSHFPTFAAFQLLGHRYYDPLRLPLLRLGSLRITLDPRYLAFSPLSFASPSGRRRSPFSAWPFLYSGLPSRYPPQGDGGPLEFPVYPYVYMPRSWTPVVSFQLAFAFPGLLPSVSRKTSAFPACAGLSFRTTTIIFSELCHAACTLATPGFIHTLMDMHAGSLQFQWLTFSGGNSAVTCLHPLGSNIQFHNLHFDPTDLNLLDTIAMILRSGLESGPTN